MTSKWTPFDVEKPKENQHIRVNVQKSCNFDGKPYSHELLFTESWERFMIRLGAELVSWQPIKP
jgi:hypothetical protein